MAIFPEFWPWVFRPSGHGKRGRYVTLIRHHNKKKRRCRPRAFDRTILFSRRNNTNTNTNTNTNERTHHMTKLYAVLVGSLLLAGGSSAMARPDADDTLTQIHWLPNVADLKALLAEATERTAKFELKAALEEAEAEEVRAYAEHGAKFEANLKAVLAELEAKEAGDKAGVDAGVSALFDAIRSPLPMPFGRRLQVDVGGALAGMAADDATNLAQAGAEQVAQEAVGATLSASGMSQQQPIGQAADDVAKAGADAGVTAITDAIGGGDIGGDLAGMAATDATNIVQAGAEQVAQETVNATLSASGMSQQQAAADEAAADNVAKVGVDAGVSAITNAIGGPFG